VQEVQYKVVLLQLKDAEQMEVEEMEQVQVLRQQVEQPILVVAVEALWVLLSVLVVDLV
jgi:hypothetical protein